jgi:HAD superfamily hydrolase (TIGR01509 family)
MPAFVQSVTDMLDRHSIPYEKEALVRTVTPLGADATAQYLIDLGIDMTKKEMLDALRNHSMSAYLYSIPEKPNAKKFLEALASNGKRIYMLTANSHIQIDPCLKRLGMYGYFTEIWSCDDLDMKKTDVAIYDKVAELIGVEKKDILFFDDNPDAIKTAKAAGLRTCGVYDESSRMFVDVMKKTADKFVYELGELLKEEI